MQVNAPEGDAAGGAGTRLWQEGGARGTTSEAAEATRDATFDFHEAGQETEEL